MTEEKVSAQTFRNLPGSSISRSSTFIVFVILMIIGLLYSPERLPPQLSKLSIICLAIVALLIICSGQYSRYIEDSGLGRIKNARVFFRPKLLINSAMLLFFLVICFWVISLGGILTSPYADLLAVSPIYLIWQILRREEEGLYQRILEDWRKVVNDKEETKKDIATTYLRWIRILQWSPLVIICLTVSLGEVLIRKINFHMFILGKHDTAPIFDSMWYLATSYTVYFVAVLSTILGVFPKEIKDSIARKTLL